MGATVVVHSVPTKLAAYPKFATRPELPPLVPRDGGPEARIDGPVIIKSVARFLAYFGASYFAFLTAADCSMEAVR